MQLSPPNIHAALSTSGSERFVSKTYLSILPAHDARRLGFMFFMFDWWAESGVLNHKRWDGGKKWRAGCLSLARCGCGLSELSGDGKPSIICGAETGAVLWIRHKSLTEQIRTAVQCPWKRGKKYGKCLFLFAQCVSWTQALMPYVQDNLCHTLSLIHLGLISLCSQSN